MKFIYIILSLFIAFTSLDAQDAPMADCLILEDENSIICKYTHQRVEDEKTVLFQWIEPDGTVSRDRNMTIPPFHGSIYDYRYIKGRTAGVWTFKVIDQNQTFSTNFTIE